MSISPLERLSAAARRVFLEPKNAVHRQYEALRAYFIEGTASAEAARRFGYSPGSFRVLCHEFRQNPNREFFLASRTKAPHVPRRDAAREQVIALRKQNLSIYDISRTLVEKGGKRRVARGSATHLELMHKDRTRNDKRLWVPLRDVRPDVGSHAGN